VNQPLQKCAWHHHDHFPFPNPSHSCNSCALAIAFGSDKQSKCCLTHRVVVITMKSKGNNNKPVLKSCDYQNVATTEKIPLRRRVCVCLPSHGHVIIHSTASSWHRPAAGTRDLNNTNKRPWRPKEESECPFPGLQSWHAYHLPLFSNQQLHGRIIL
jgi:hypothetical protein